MELLVASSCTGLLAAGVLGLAVNSAATVRGRMMRLDATMRAERCAEELARDLRRSARGLGSRTRLIVGTGLVGVVEPAASGVQVALTEALPVEVDQLSDGVYRVTGLGELTVDTQVAAVGLAAASPAVPVANVVQAGRFSAEQLVEVGWQASQRRILQEHGPVRALVPLTLRTYQTRHTETGVELRRRDDAGSWQPVVDGLAGVDIRYGLAGELGASPLGLAESLLRSAEIVTARIDCAASSADVRVQAVRWAGIGRR